MGNSTIFAKVSAFLCCVAKMYEAYNKGLRPVAKAILVRYHLEMSAGSATL